MMAAAATLSRPLHAGTFTTYAAWSDVAAKNRGRMYIYTGNFASTDVSLFNATAPNVQMNTMYCGFPVNGVGPYQPVFEVGSCPVPPTGGFGNNYFRCQSNNPIIWEVEEDISSSEEDSHDFLAAANSGNDYIGSVFMTYFRDDTKAGAGILYGDHCAIFNPGGAPITVTVRKWTGVPPAGAWGAPIALANNTIPAMGVWMWAPDMNGTLGGGGTEAGNEGHYRFDISGGEGMLYKGNTFNPYTAPGNRDNLIHLGPDIGDGTKVGNDLLGAVVTDGQSPHIVITNQGGAPVNFEILKFNPNTLGDAGLWPISHNDASGTWAVVQTGTIATNDSFFYNAGALTNAGFYRVRSTNGQPISAEFGSRILQELWCDGDYLYATDTRRAFGRLFRFGGAFFNGTDPIQLHVIAPLANTTVNVVIDGSISGPGFFTSTQTNAVADAGLSFAFVRPAAGNQFFTARITSDKIIYAYIMSSTSVGSTAPGETFFSVPPPIDPILLVTKSVSRAVATLGDTLTYTLIAENPGSGNVTNARIWDTLPPGVGYVSSVPPYSSALGQLYTWNLGTLGSQASATVLIEVVVNAGTQLEVKHNTASAISDLTQLFQSNDAPFTILIPGADLQKTVDKAQAMPGDTLTYVLTYTNTQPPLPNTPRLNLQATTGSYDGGSYRTDFNVTNYSGGSININDLKICYWIFDDAPPGNLNFANDYGGGTSPWAWGGPTVVGTKSVWSPPQNLPGDRRANLQVCVQATSGQILADGQTWTGIQPRWYVNYPEVFDNHADDYSRNPGGTGVEDHHFALYYQGQLVTEYTNASTPDPETGSEPSYLWLEDMVPANVNYLGSTPSANVSLPQLTWTVDSVRPASSKSFTWWGEVPLGTPGGTIIPNDANGSTANGPTLSNKVETLIGSANVSLIKSINKNVFTLGETVTYCMAWSNTGTASVNIRIWDTLHPVLTYVGSDNGGSLGAGNVVTWNLGSQAANSSGSVCVWAYINAYPALPPFEPLRFDTVQGWRRLLAFLPSRRLGP